MTELRTSPVSHGELFSERARQYAQDRPLPERISILEAGCGWGSGLDLGDLAHQVIGVDVESPALRAHTRRRADLATWHLGDLRTVPMPPRAYDVVYAPYVIERVPHAELVLDRMVAALKPGGLLMITLRDRNTAFGFLDRTLPPWLRETLWDEPGGPRRPGPPAGGPPPKPAPAPLPPPAAVYDPVASRQGMRWYCVMRGLVIAEEYASRRCLEAQGAGSGLAGRVCEAVAALSRGRLTAEHSEVSLVIRKPENRFARVI
ncbi:class I SAM-dependent methyltransferase [Actinomadura hibisca]|uniref:class I SAM-dependent methyltransferase n=1 Tax=Actinomadura hibisca TaxID=68565 RepID=UPI00083232FF|nr:class I SAM-dependent methyltransferase [Actinomadura hibisca]